jgi:DNA-binding GntR family transcriptional regulator
MRRDYTSRSGSARAASSTAGLVFDSSCTLDIISNVEVTQERSVDAPDGYHSLSDIAFHRLRDAIIDGRLTPGQWLRQEAIAREFGMSQMPVREALRRLVTEGLAERMAYRGVRVVEFTAADVADMFTVRLLLESLAVRFAASNIGPAELEDLENLLRRAEHCCRPDAMSLRRELNTEFHVRICRASGHRYLVHQIESLWRWFPSVMLYEGMRRQEELAPARLAREMEEHRAILRALEARDARAAEEETRRHIGNLSQELTEVLGVSPALIEPLCWP